MAELLIPVSSNTFEIGDTTLLEFKFSDGSEFLDVQFSKDGDHTSILSDSDGRTVCALGEGRYPYSDRVARFAIDHFNNCGKLPEWIGQ